MQIKAQNLGTNGRGSCGLIQPGPGPSVRTWAAYGVLLGFVAHDRGSDVSSLSPPFSDGPLLILALEGKQLLLPFCCVLSASILFGGLLLAWVSF